MKYVSKDIFFMDVYCDQRYRILEERKFIWNDVPHIIIVSQEMQQRLSDPLNPNLMCDAAETLRSSVLRQRMSSCATLHLAIVFSVGAIETEPPGWALGFLMQVRTPVWTDATICSRTSECAGVTSRHRVVSSRQILYWQ